MIKPILISTDKQSIEIGDLTLPNHSNKINEGELGTAVRSFVRNDAYKAYDIILIDTEAEIIEGDLYLVDDINIHICEKIVSKTIYSTKGLGINKNDNCHKIISSTNKSHKRAKKGACEDIPYLCSCQDLPLPSEASIKLLVNYYNENKCMPESIEVETQRNFEYNPDIYGTSVYSRYNTSDCKPNKELDPTIKLNQQGEIEITIPEVSIIDKLYNVIEAELELFNAMNPLSKMSMMEVLNQLKSKKK